jgi:drug/metabolite transporter (DMT)-like permease
MLAVLLGLGAATLWGISDFIGGVLARRVPVFYVTFVGQAASLAVLGAVVLVAGPARPSLAQLVPAAVAGVAAGFGLAAFYYALAIGTISIAAPIAATGVVTPVAIGLLGGDRVAPLQLAGIALAIAGVVLASRSPQQAGSEARAASRRSIAFALVAALAIGMLFTGVDAASEHGVVWALFVLRTVAVTMLMLTWAARRPPPPPAALVVPLLAVGLFDTTATGLFGLAGEHGALSIVAVLGALYPIPTVLLARSILHERLTRTQRAGVAAALCGVVAIAS